MALLQRLKRLRELWQMTEHDEFMVIDLPKLTAEEAKVLEESGIGRIERLPDENTGRGEFMPFMTEDEMMADIKERELGWGSVFKKVRELDDEESS